MFTRRVKQLNPLWNHCRYYLTSGYANTYANAVKTVPVTSVDLTTAKQFNSVVIDADIFVNKLVDETTDRHRDVMDHLINLRASTDACKANDYLSYKVIEHFLATNNVEQLLHVLEHRLSFGVFMDKFLGCYLMDKFLQSSNFKAAAKIAVEMMLQEDMDNDVVVGLSLIACYEHLQTNTAFEVKAEEEAPAAPSGKEKEKKVRVKFLRNLSEPKTDLEIIGSYLLKLASKHQSLSMLAQDLQLLGLLLSKQYSAALEAFESANASITLYSETLDICKKILEAAADKEYSEKLLALADNLSNKGSIKQELQTFTQNAVDNSEAQLVAEQAVNQKLWNEKRELLFKQELANFETKHRIANMNSIMQDIDSNLQKIRFFKLEDQLDLDIYRKRPRYSKRWFGKKKKPRVQDDGYIPPEIIRK